MKNKDMGIIKRANSIKAFYSPNPAEAIMLFPFHCTAARRDSPVGKASGLKDPSSEESIPGF